MQVKPWLVWQLEVASPAPKPLPLPLTQGLDRLPAGNGRRGKAGEHVEDRRMSVGGGDNHVGVLLAPVEQLLYNTTVLLPSMEKVLLADRGLYQTLVAEGTEPSRAQRVVVGGNDTTAISSSSRRSLSSASPALSSLGLDAYRLIG